MYGILAGAQLSEAMYKFHYFLCTLFVCGQLMYCSYIKNTFELCTVNFQGE